LRSQMEMSSPAGAGHRLPGALSHDLRDVVIAEPEMLADERAGNRPRRSLAAQPGLNAA